MTSGEVKQLKVDNWGVFFLQRLQILLNKGEQCDLTLKFKNGKPIKVHKLVLTACTDYFENLPRDGSELQMPNTLKHEHVLPIVNFMYTGRLEYNVDEHSMFYETAKALNLTILARLLNAQMKTKPPTQPTVIKSYSRKPTTPATSQPPTSPTPSTSSPIATSTPSALPGKKLPIWKKRTVSGFLADESPASDVTPVPKIKAEIPRPTRFEWPEDFEEPPVIYNPTFDNLSYDTKPMLKPVDNLTPLNIVLKGASGIAADTPSTPKSFKRTGPSIVLGGSRKKRVKLSERVFSAPESDDDDDDHFETHYMDDDDDEDEYLPQTPVISSKATSPKPILKPLSSETPTPSPSKKVRFSLSTSEGKENTTVKGETVVNEISTPTTNISVTSEGAKSTNSANHAKIIAEVLKKYPDLVKGNKNIKLKIVTPGSGALPNTTLPVSVNSDKDSKAVQAKVSYVVMKSDPNLKKPALPVPLTGPENTTGPWMCIACGTSVNPLMFDTYYLYRKHLHNVHNERIDARICEHCGYKASKRNLHLYHLYTKHNIPPPRNINFPKCDKCDYIALSESLLIKHRNNHSTCTKEYMCPICNAAFKSNGALQGHMQTNLHQDGGKKDYECEYCAKIFNRNINLKAHIRTAHQEESRKLYDDEERVDDPDPQSDQNILQVIEVPVINSVQSNEKGQHTLLLQPGMTILAESPSVPLMPSSESEAMNNVATGIATSINITDAADMVGEQTVILLDDNSEFILQSAPMVLNQDGTCQEYIVPEIMTSESGQVFSTGLVNYTVGNGIYSSNVVNNNMVEENMIEENMIKSSDHTYADDGTPHVGHSNVQVNGCTEVRVTDNIIHDNAHHQGVIIINASDERGSDDETQVTSEILIDNSSGTLLMDADWVHVNNISHETEIVEDKNDVKVITPDSGVGSDNLSSISPDDDKIENVNKKVADNLVKEWDLDDDTVEDDEQEDNDIKPSRPTIELDETILDNI